MDTIEGVRVALKIPSQQLMSDQLLKEFKSEVRLTARLDHPNILPLKYADFIDDHFVIVFPLGDRTLADRLRNRMSVETALNFAEQMLEATAYAHRHRIVHCDIKPENMILFANNHLRLSDFGIAKIAQRTIRGSGTGTVGYMAPEQAMGKPSQKSDVFSLGLLIYRMFSGQWPEWPYEAPLPGERQLKQKAHPDLVSLILRAIDTKPRNRFRDADHMLSVFGRLKRKALLFAQAKRSRRNSAQWKKAG